MTLDPRFICSSDLEGIFLDKLTGLPLASGVVKFYSDESRATPKTVYRLTGSPPYSLASYSAIGTQVTLNSVGGYQYAGDSIVIYYFPYECTLDGDPETATTTQELYYVTVENSGGTQQFTREAWPPLATNLTPYENEASLEVQNFIPNGQFLYHNDPEVFNGISPAQTIVTVGGATNTKLDLAQGGWSFQQTQGSAGVYDITFNDESNVLNPGLRDYPNFSVNINCTSAGAETMADLVVMWPNVNEFSYAVDALTPQVKFNLLIAGKLNSGVAADFTVWLTSYYGVGGSAATQVQQVPANDFTVSTLGYVYYNIPIQFPDNSGKTIGEGNYVALSIRGPSGQAYNARFTDFALTITETNLTRFPTQTNAQMLADGVAGWMPTPNPDGSDLYLPLVLTPNGMNFDSSQIGQLIAKTQITAVNNELLMNGTAYVASAYNATTGIPYSRLMSYLLLNSPAVSISAGAATILANTVPLMGTGPQFVTLFNEAAQPTHFLVQMNTAAAGGTATQVSASITIAATSVNNYYTATVASVPSASDYWTFTAPTSGLVYNVWYEVNGSGEAPAIPGTSIKVTLGASETTTTVATKTIAAVNQHQFYLPNMAGLFLRGLDTTGIYDLDYASRVLTSIKFNGVSFTGANLGSLEGQAYLNHTHTPHFSMTQGTATASANTGWAASDGSGAQVLSATHYSITIDDSTTGGTETRPVNMAVNWFIKY